MIGNIIRFDHHDTGEEISAIVVGETHDGNLKLKIHKDRTGERMWYCKPDEVKEVIGEVEDKDNIEHMGRYNVQGAIEDVEDENTETVETAEDVEEIINVLLGRGLSPGQAWAYYGVHVKGYSRNEWSEMGGYSDHSAVSEPLRKAIDKLSNDRYPMCPNCDEAVRIDGTSGLNCMMCGTDIPEPTGL